MHGQRRIVFKRHAPCNPPMKTNIFSMMTALSIMTAASATAQEGPMNAGLVQSLSKEQGTLTIRTEQSGGGPIVYHGMNRAEILTVGGKPATLADIAQGQRVTVFYAKQGDRWVVSRVVIPEPGSTAAAAATTTTTTTTPATVVTPGGATTDTSKAATDGDRTTRPGNSAATDGDRTTRPPNSAATDGDRTTVPADGPRRGLRRQ
jgi:hypothetical protein